MTSPFPGVDPYIEAQDYWPDFHMSFITYLRDALNDVLPDHYDARIDERLSLVDASADVGDLEPGTVPLIIEEETRETFIEIRHRPERMLVATLELLSPANKEEPGGRSYLNNACPFAPACPSGRAGPAAWRASAPSERGLPDRELFRPGLACRSAAGLQRVCLADPAASARHPDPATRSRPGHLDRPGGRLRTDLPARPIRTLNRLLQVTGTLTVPGRSGVGPSGGLRSEGLKMSEREIG